MLCHASNLWIRIDVILWLHATGGAVYGPVCVLLRCAESVLHAHSFEVLQYCDRNYSYCHEQESMSALIFL